MIGAVFGVVAAGRTRWRRARNLRAGGRAGRAAGRIGVATPAAAAGAAEKLPRTAQDGRSTAWSALRRAAHPAGLGWLDLGCLLLAVAGAATIVVHARWLGAAAGAAGDDPAGQPGPAALRGVLAGAAFTVPSATGLRVETHAGATLLLLSGLRAEPARRIDLCTQLADPAAAHARIVPVHAGLRFAEVAAMHGVPLRNAMLASSPMPHATIAGDAAAGLALRWTGGPARWIGAAGVQPQPAAASGAAGLGRDGWLLWNDGALRIMHRAGGACARAGELVLQLYRPGADAGRALAVAYPAGGGAAVEARLAPGDYRLPAAPPVLEDQQLFERLRERGLVRLDADGLVALAPPDLAAWRALPGRTPWDDVALDGGTARLLERLYRKADGEFVREQVRIFNAERRLLAWRMAARDTLVGEWQAEAGGAPAPVANDAPPALCRLFARMPQGWSGWRRIADWPGAGGTARIAMPLPAQGGAGVRLLLAGRVVSVAGARLAGPPRPACTGRACRRADDVQVLDLVPEPGARLLSVEAAPLATDALALPADARYRHIVLRGGRLAWQALPASARPAHAPEAAVVLADGAGRPLWHDGAPTAAARAAGLSVLLGVREDGGVAGMLARLPGAGAHDAALSIDLDWQRTAQAALDCIGMRRGRWDGQACRGGADAPEGRQAGMVVLDAETGAILAAAGAGGAPVDASNWLEARAFDRHDPAASPLRLPAWQHDGGAERSPGSTFKVVSALGLELAARDDARLDALLSGQPLAAINAGAAAGGWAFRTDAPAYPLGSGAHVTNFRDQGLDRRAEAGRLGLAQALTYSLNTWFAWTGELADRSLAGTPAGGTPDLQALAADALDGARPIVAMARRLGFGQALRLDGGLLPADYPWSAWDPLQATPAGIDPVHSRHELRQMAIGLRMQATPLQMALVAAAVGQGRIVHPYVLARLDGRAAAPAQGPGLGVRLDRIRAGMKGVVDSGTAAAAFRGADLAKVARGLSGKTGTAPLADGKLATVWFTGWLEPHSLPGQAHRLALAVFVSRSEATGGEHAAPIAAAVLRAMAAPPGSPSRE